MTEEEVQRPIQIISTGNPDDESSTFTVIDQNLDMVMKKVMCPTALILFIR